MSQPATVEFVLPNSSHLISGALRLCVCFGLFFLGLFCPLASHAEQTSLLLSPVKASVISLTKYIDVLEDPSTKLELKDVQSEGVASQFKRHLSSAESFDFGFTRSAYWFRLRVSNQGDAPLTRFLQIDYPLLTRIEIFYPQPDGSYLSKVTGFDLPFSTYAYPNRHFVFPLRIQAGVDQTIYFRINSIDAIVVPAKLWEPEAFYSYERNDYFGQALYFGMAASMVLFNLLFYLGAARNSIYLLYVSFGTCFILTMAAKNGLAHEFLWPQAGAFSNIAVVAGFALSLGTLIIFMRRMLETRTTIPRIDISLRLMIVALFVTPFLLVYSLQTFIKMAAALYGVAALCILFASSYCAWQRQRSAYFFVAAFSFWVMGTGFVVLRAFGLMGTNFFTVYGIQIGSIFEMFLLALALADRFNILRRETELERINALVAQEKLLNELESARSILEVKVNERTARLTQTLENLRLTRDELVQSAKLADLGSLVASVSHELNRPIGHAVISASSLEDVTVELQTHFAAGSLRKSNLTHYASHASSLAKVILNACSSAAEMVRSFKQVAVDQTSEHRRKFNLHDVVEDVVTTQKTAFTKFPWVFLIEVPADIVCDSYPGPLGQIVANIVQNAALHAFAGRAMGTLVIKGTLIGQTVQIDFIDNGVGMSANQLREIFEPFYTTSAERGGSGLGLTVSANIAFGVLGGNLQATSILGVSSTFRLCFPSVAPIMP